MKRFAFALLALLAVPAVVGAQPEDRRRAPTAPPVTSADPWGDADRMRGPNTGWPGFDPRLPVPAGATSFTGIAPLGRDPSRNLPQPALPDQAYQSGGRPMNR